MSDVAVYFMWDPPTFELPPGPERSQRYMFGDTVSVKHYANAKMPPNITQRPDGSGPGRSRVVRTLGVPHTFEEFTALVLAPWPDSSLNPTGRHPWRIVQGRLQSISVMDDLENLGWAELTWAQLEFVYINNAQPTQVLGS